MPKRKPRYQHHKASGQARARIDGRDHYLGPYGSPESRDRYDDLIAEWLLTNGDTVRYTPTVDDLCILYMEHAELRKRMTPKKRSHAETRPHDLPFDAKKVTSH